MTVTRLRHRLSRLLLCVAAAAGAAACDSAETGLIAGSPTDRAIAFPIRVQVAAQPGGEPGVFVLSHGRIRRAEASDAALPLYRLARHSPGANRAPGARVADMGSVDEQYVCEIPPGTYSVVDGQGKRLGYLVVLPNCKTEFYPGDYV